SVKWMGEDITNEVELKWEIGSGAQEGVVSIISKSNGEVSLKGVAIGETDVYVSVTVGDVYVNQKISVTVCDSSIWYESEELEIGANGNFMLKMLALSSDGNENRVDIPTIFAYQNGEKIQNASFEWISKDESIVKIEGGKLVAKRAGLVNLHGVYAGNEVVLSVLVERSSVYIEEIVNFELADLKPVELDALVNENGEVYLQGAQIGSLEEGKIILDASKYPTSSKVLGSCELVVETDKSSYYIPTNLYSMIIETPEELDAWHSFAFEQEDDGYFVLGNNIAYNGAYTGSRNWDKSGYAWASPDNVGFKGIFDGNGYVIDGLRIESGFRGFVTLLQSDGIIRNVSFINASYSAIGAYLCQWGCGTIENVYVQYGIDARTGYYDKNTALGGAFLAADNTRNMVGKMTIKNCFVDVRRTSLEHDYQSYIGGYMKYDKTNALWMHDGAYAMLNGVYVIGPATTLKGGEAKLHYNDLVEGSINYGLYHSADEMASDSKTQAVIAQWDSSFWGIKNGMPIPLSVMVLGDVYVVNKPSTSGYYTFEGDTTVYSGDNYTFTV
ncbi:MAG: hypothetical protein IJA15_06075, partial [Clostridia bacterium]|nr:hypothetical protein [Clostridia bacterium]